MPRPNVVFIIADDQRHDTIRALGNGQIHTPVLDSLVEAGTAFEKMHITGSLTPAICVPSRACVLTGRHVLHATAGTRLNHWQDMAMIHPQAALLPQVMRESGYYTFATGKWHNDRQSFVKSFQDGAKIFFGGMSDHHRVPVYDFDPAGVYPRERRYEGERFSTELFTDAAVDFIRNYDQPNPFFLYAAYTSPHDPRTAPEEFRRLYDPEQIDLPDNFLEEHPFDNGEMRVRDELLGSTPRSEAEVRRHTAEYYAMVSHLDNCVGRVLEALSERDRLHNTIVVFTSDHGLALGRHGLMGKQNLYDHSIRIPTVMVGPGILSGRRVDALTCQYDIFPTLCELVGIPVPPSVEGTSLVPLLRGETRQVYESVFAVYKDLQRMVSDGRWKLIRYYRPEEHNYGTDRLQLFHVEQDPWETRDRSEDEACRDQLERMAAMLSAWQRRMDDPWAYRPAIPPKQQRGTLWGNWND